jgi:hypothetical protein
MALPAPSPQKKPQRSQSSGVVDLSRARPRPVEPSGPTAQPDNAIYPDTPQWKKQGQAQSPQEPTQEQSQGEGGVIENLPAYQDEALEDDVYQEGGGESDTEASEQDRPHFSFIEAFLFVSVSIIGDLVEYLGLTGFGLIVGFIVDWVVGPIKIFWFWMKGVDFSLIWKYTKFDGFEFIPGIEFLPIRTITTILTIVAVNKPETFEKLGVVGEVVEAVATKGKSIKKELAEKATPKKEG